MINDRVIIRNNRKNEATSSQNFSAQSRLYLNTDINGPYPISRGQLNTRSYTNPTYQLAKEKTKAKLLYMLFASSGNAG